MPASQSLTGRCLWRFALDNRTDAPVANASVTINSGHSVAILGVGSVPVTLADSDLQPGESILVLIENGNVPATFTPGFDSERTVSPLIVPPGLSTQLVTVRVIPRDPRYLKPDPAFNPHIGVNIKVGPGSVIITDPDVTDGEDDGGGGQTDPGGAHWLIHGVLLDKTYVFAATVEVNNPTGSPQCSKPALEVGMTSHSEAAPDAGTRFQGGENSIQVGEPTLDGPTAGAGLATYSADQDLSDGHSHVWLSRLQDGFTVDYRNQFGGICTPPAGFLIIDEDSIDNDAAPNFFSANDVNDQIAEIGVRRPLPAFSGGNVGTEIVLRTGEVGDEGWFAPKDIPEAWRTAGPSPDGLQNYLLAGPGLGSPDANGDRESLLDKIPSITPLRATGLKLLEGKPVCAVVYDSDLSINFYDENGNRTDGSLKGANLGIVAFKVKSVTARSDGSSSSLPEVRVEILNPGEVCKGPLVLFKDAPVPTSSSEPFYVIPPE